MAGPHLELFRFAFYLFFPVAALVHYGNPDWYDRHVIPVSDLLHSTALSAESSQYRERMLPAEERMTKVRDSRPRPIVHLNPSRIYLQIIQSCNESLLGSKPRSWNEKRLRRSLLKVPYQSPRRIVGYNSAIPLPRKSQVLRLISSTM
jgi:hypothetical protein